MTVCQKMHIQFASKFMKKSACMSLRVKKRKKNKKKDKKGNKRKKDKVNS